MSYSNCQPELPALSLAFPQQLSPGTGLAIHGNCKFFPEACASVSVLTGVAPVDLLHLFKAGS